MTDPRTELTDQERERLTDGFHDEVAESLRTRGRPDMAAWVREQIWDWDGALADYLAAGQRIDALRVAVESGAAAHLDRALGRDRGQRRPGHGGRRDRPAASAAALHGGGASARAAGRPDRAFAGVWCGPAIAWGRRGCSPTRTIPAKRSMC